MTSIDGVAKLIQIFKSNFLDDRGPLSAYLMEEQDICSLSKFAEE